MKITAKNILDALIAYSDDKIWCSELSFNGGERRIDFWTLEPHNSKNHRTISYEIKVTRADFMRDSEEKQKHALKYSDRFFYVAPKGLIKADEIPSWAGLQEWDGKYFTVAKRAPKREKSEPDWPMIVSLIRNSGDMRRDIDFMKENLRFYMQKCERMERIEEIRRDRNMGKYIRSGVIPRQG